MGWIGRLIDKILLAEPKPTPRLSQEEEDKIMKEFSVNRDKRYYCKCCGKITYVPHRIREFYDYYCKTNGDKIIYPICNHCGSLNSFVYSMHNDDYYYNRSVELFGDRNHDDTILFEEEIETNPDFDREKFKMHCKEVAEINARSARSRLDAYMNLNNDTTPRCPTCRSSFIEPISTTKKVVGAAAFGLYSKNATCQFVCKNCGYKW